jgi:hypothetical protein
MAGIVEVHGDFFEDDFFLGGEVGLADGRAEQVGEVLDGRSVYSGMTLA